MNQRPSDNGLVVFGMIVTAAIHAAVIASYLLFGVRETVASEPTEMLDFTTVDPIGWGEIRDPHALPEISNPAPEVQPEEVVAVAEPQDVDPPEQDDRERTREETPPEAPQDSSRHNPERPVNEVAPEGRPDGVRGFRGVDDSAVDLWSSRVLAGIQRAYRQPPGLTEGQMRDLEGRVRIYVNRDGRITRFRWTRRSDNEIWNDSVERTLNMFRLGSRRLELPFDNEEILNFFVEEGLHYTFRF